MSMLEVHAEALASVNEAHHSFLLKYSRSGRIVYGFVEGRDDPMFYRAMIERFLPDGWEVELIPSGGKDKVYAAHSALNWDIFSSKRVAFFVDRDLSAFLGSDNSTPANLYVTDGYSIENDVVTGSVFLRLLEEVCNVVDYSGNERRDLLKRFNEDLLLFKEFLVPVMAQIMAWRADGVEANLSNLDLRPFFYFEGGRLALTGEFSSDDARIEHLCACVGAERTCLEQLEVFKEQFLEGRGLDFFVRGKYLVWFLARSVLAFHSEIHRFVTSYSRPPKLKMSFGPSNIMVIAAPRARISASLKSFLEATFLAHVIENS